MAQWREESKTEAKKLGFMTNKRALSANPRLSNVVMDPRSAEQVTSLSSMRTNQVRMDQPISLVVDIMEGRRIGMPEVPEGMCNYIVLKVELLKIAVLRGRTTLVADTRLLPMYSMFTESKGSKHTCWIDKFNISAFPLPYQCLIGIETGKPSLRLTLKQGTLNQGTLDAIDPANLFEMNGNNKEVRVNLTIKEGERSWSRMVPSLEPIVLKPTWYVWRSSSVRVKANPLVKLTVQLVETAKIPVVRDFLPYTMWPPMVLFTKKSRLDLMMEEEEQEEEKMFEGKLGDKLISYNPATLPRILGVFAGDYNRDFLQALGLVMGAPLIDRTGTLAVAKYDFSPDPTDPERRFSPFGWNDKK